MDYMEKKCGAYPMEITRQFPQETNSRSNEVEDWEIATKKKKNLINKAEDKPSYNFRAWLTTSALGLAFCTGDIHDKIERQVVD